MTATDRRHDIAAKLDAIEAELKAIGFWTDDPPQSSGPLDEAGFEVWLQTVFLPNARHAVATDDFPKKSQVGVMALRQYDYHSQVPEAFGLLQLLNEFDDLVNGVRR